mmetsp:Transcript_29077/g.28042  ORF Transcript_29077/g.28042 Transcript_29077/m.28042 type:complete len:182 (-) Transcript_29077:2652-3197(-)
MMKNNERNQEIKRLRETAAMLRDNSVEIKSNLGTRKHQTEKAKKNTREVDKMPIGKLCNQIQDLKNLDNAIEYDKKDVADVERRFRDLIILFKDVIKAFIKDLFNELQNKMSQRTKQVGALTKKDQTLLGVIEKRKSDLLAILNQLEDEDAELHVLYKSLENSLNEANSDEDGGSVYLRQL